MRRRSIRRLRRRTEDPLEGLANFFDLGLVFALAFMVALLASLQRIEIVERAPMKVTDPASGEAVDADRTRIDRYRESRSTRGGEGTRLGTAYRLRSGEVIYIPEGN
ncbi:MAG: DUF2149 domain-containing protein [Planctomycetes bacterium]|nr:DUF2149 domain-containing protein [Planctomycetota bacterium]